MLTTVRLDHRSKQKIATSKVLAPLRGADPIISPSRWSPRTPTTGYFLCNPSGCAEVSQPLRALGQLPGVIEPRRGDSDHGNRSTAGYEHLSPLRSSPNPTNHYPRLAKPHLGL